MSEASLSADKEVRESAKGIVSGQNGAVDAEAMTGEGAVEAKAPVYIPKASELKAELARSTQKTRFRLALRNAIFVVVAVAAAAVLLAMLLMPVLRIYGTSMSPTLTEGNVVLAMKSADFKQGDIVAFYYNNKVLVKRVVAGPGSWVDISDDGTVTVNGNAIDEPYLSAPAKGQTDLTYPYQVPDGRYFVMGDNRETSVDSRASAIGSISEDQIVGKVIARVWPLNEFKLLG